MFSLQHFFVSRDFFKIVLIYHVKAGPPSSKTVALLFSIRFKIEE